MNPADILALEVQTTFGSREDAIEFAHGQSTAN